MSAAGFEPFESFGRIVEDGERLKILRRKVSGMLMAKHDRFPGAQPVSLGRGGLGAFSFVRGAGRGARVWVWAPARADGAGPGCSDAAAGQGSVLCV